MGKKGTGGGLGSRLIKTRFKNQRAVYNNGEASLVHTSDVHEPKSGPGNLSVTEQGSLDEFLATAELAGTEFTAERLNVRVVTGEVNEAVLSNEERRLIEEAQKENKDMLRIPRRPKWDSTMTAEELHERERITFLEWRRHLAALEEKKHILLTPFEKNIEFWRQLWRVVERSDLIVQIVDARNCLLFRCEDLEAYIHELNPNKQNLLLLNKSDLLTDEQRTQWADYLRKENIPFVFFSAARETEIQKAEAAEAEAKMQFPLDEDEYVAQNEKLTEDLEAARVKPFEKKGQSKFSVLSVEDDDDEEESDDETKSADNEANAAEEHGDSKDQTSELKDDESGDDKEAAEEDEEGNDSSQEEAEKPQVFHSTEEIYTCDMLLRLFVSMNEGIEQPTVGMVGYPNVGKSSTINALCREKKVGVSATPGRTKHFQTILLGGMMLCDCPGLVFPTFVSTKAEMVCNGILPIDQLRDCIAPVTFVCQRIPRDILELTYGINIIKPSPDDAFPDRPPTAFELMNAYSYARGYMTSSGQPDIPRGARYILKDYVKGKLLYCEPAPGHEVLESLHPTDLLEKAGNHMNSIDAGSVGGPKHKPVYVNQVDAQFFDQATVKAKTNGVRGSQDHRTAFNPADPGQRPKSKKHYKRNKKEKTRRVMKG